MTFQFKCSECGADRLEQVNEGAYVRSHVESIGAFEVNGELVPAIGYARARVEKDDQTRFVCFGCGCCIATSAEALLDSPDVTRED
jgi:hypothetical protein